MGTIFYGRWQDMLRRVPMANLVLTDPPYGVTPQTWDTRPEWPELLEALSAATSDSGQLWIFVRMPWAVEVHHAALRAGWRFRQELIWKKQNAGGCTAKTLRKVHENLWHFVKPQATTFNKLRVPKTTKGDKSVTKRCTATTQHFGTGKRSRYVDDGYRLQTTVADIRNLHRSPESKGHPTQKPLDLLKIPILHSTNPGDVVLDPFAGSGSSVVCAELHGRDGWGIEASGEWAAVGNAWRSASSRRDR